MRRVNVLLIEDNPGDVRLIQEGIKEYGADMLIDVRVAWDGEHALGLLADGLFRPDVILLDLNLPKIGGRFVLEWIRARVADEYLRKVPVVVFSSSEHGIAEVLASGATHYIVKPTGLNEFLRAVERIVVLYIKPSAAA